MTSIAHALAKYFEEQGYQPKTSTFGPNSAWIVIMIVGCCEIQFFHDAPAICVVRHRRLQKVLELNVNDPQLLAKIERELTLEAQGEAYDAEIINNNYW